MYLLSFVFILANCFLLTKSQAGDRLLRCARNGGKTLIVETRTADTDEASTDTDIWLYYHDRSCNCVKYVYIDEYGDDFERGATDLFFPCVYYNAYLTRIGLYRNSWYDSPNWNVTHLKVLDLPANRCLSADFSHCHNGKNYGTAIPSGQITWSSRTVMYRGVCRPVKVVC